MENNLIYSDGKIDIIRTKNNADLPKDIDIGVTRGDYLVITHPTYGDEDFIFENDDAYIVDLETGLCWSNNEVASLEELRNVILDKDQWDFISNLLKEQTLYASCDLQGKPDTTTFSEAIKWDDLKDYFRKYSEPPEVLGSVIYDILTWRHEAQVYIDNLEKFIANIVSDISEKNLKQLAQKFNLSEEDVIKALTRADVRSDDYLKLYNLIHEALYSTLYRTYWDAIWKDASDGVKNCFPLYFKPYIGLDSEAFHIKNCPKYILSKLMDDYIEEAEEDSYLSEIYLANNLIDLIGSYIFMNLSVPERYSYEEYNADIFNDFLNNLIAEQ